MFGNFAATVALDALGKTAFHLFKGTNAAVADPFDDVEADCSFDGFGVVAVLGEGVHDDALELLDLAKDTAGEIGKYMFSDSATKYKTTPTEKLSLNAINLINYLAQGDLEGATIEAKRFTVMPVDTAQVKAYITEHCR